MQVLYVCEKCGKNHAVRKGDHVGRCPRCNAPSMYQEPIADMED